jgi:hypothetical protein
MRVQEVIFEDNNKRYMLIDENGMRYQGILTNLQEGNIIFGRQDRIKRKVIAGNG